MYDIPSYLKQLIFTELSSKLGLLKETLLNNKWDIRDQCELEEIKKSVNWYNEYIKTSGDFLKHDIQEVEQQQMYIPEE